jgi:hypothetical protein
VKEVTRYAALKDSMTGKQGDDHVSSVVDCVRQHAQSIVLCGAGGGGFAFAMFANEIAMQTALDELQAQQFSGVISAHRIAIDGIGLRVDVGTSEHLSERTTAAEQTDPARAQSPLAMHYPCLESTRTIWNIESTTARLLESILTANYYTAA